jgi:DNA-binding response OmpR family regulator
MEVALVHWPAEAERVGKLRDAGTAFVLLLQPEIVAPELMSCSEDWVRLPVSDEDLRARLDLVRARADLHGTRPLVDDSGVLRYRDHWAALSPVEFRLAAPLVERFGAVVGRDALSRRAWPDGVPSRNALDVHILRLRRRITPLGLELRTVRSRGYLLQTVDA